MPADASPAKRRARLFLHSHPFGGVADAIPVRELAALVQKRPQQSLVAMEEIKGSGMAREYPDQSRNHDLGPGIASHRIN